MTERLQLFWLFVLAAPVACVAWTVTHEEVFKEVHEWCIKSESAEPRWYVRKFFYLFTCESCFSHYVAAAAVLRTGFRLLLPDWRGAVLAWFALVWVANIYMSLFGRLRLDIKREHVEIKIEEQESKRENEDDDKPAGAHDAASQVRPSPTFAGPLMTLPNLSKREPWHGQSHVFSAGFHATMQPRCGHTAERSCSAPVSSR